MNNNSNWNIDWQKKPPVIILPQSIMNRLEVERLPQNKDGLLMLWERQKKALDALKEDEMELRKECVKLLVKEVEQPKDGVNNIELGEGYVAKVTLKINYKLQGDNNKIESVLDKIETCGNEGKFLAERLIQWKATLSVAEYKDLQEQAKSSAVSKQILDLLNDIIISDDGAPTLSIREPKNKKE